ncbi:MAG: hypothetical protein DI526_04230 [Caulobacter segnis]|uniref:DUF2946 domain-containing protein n=2 Tax=Caulobacter segnis TaxID=88688 RepID=A0A2W5V839_9CAUL|nr:MAG: hypothetical protein DI526_04230 [Caulobacter segnis]
MALVLRLMIPVGFMPSQTQPSTWPFATVICTGSGQLVLQPGQAPPREDASKRPAKAAGHPTCPFGAQGVLLAPPLIILSQAAIARTLILAPPMPAKTWSASMAGPPLPARGPPARL